MQRKPPLPTSPVARLHRKNYAKDIRLSADPSVLQNMHLPGTSALPTLPNYSPMQSLSPSKLTRRNSNAATLSSVMKLDNPLNSSSPRLIKTRKAESYKPKNLPTFELEFTVNMQFISNWGDPSEITVSEVDFLNSDKVPMKVSKIVPENIVSEKMEIKEFRKISNNIMIKENDQHKWKHEWHEGHAPLSIDFTVCGLRPPDFVRIWNTGGNSSLRKFAVFIEKKLVGRSEVPESFGVVMPIKLDGIPMMPSLANIFSGNHLEAESLLKDKFGILPLDKTATIVIRVFSAFDKNSMYVGLNSIELFDVTGKEIHERDIESICVQGGNNLSSPYNLFKDARRSIELSEMWIAEKQKDVPLDIVIQLKRAMQVSLVRFWNYNYDAEAKHKGCANFCIFLEAKPYSFGRLRPGNGTLSQILNSVTDVWLCDSPELRQLSSITSVHTSRVDEDEPNPEPKQTSV